MKIQQDFHGAISKGDTMNQTTKHQLTCELEIKSITEEGRFAGYASVFGVTDNQRDVILPGAFSKSLQQPARDVRLLWQHRMDEPIGRFEQIFEDAKGLYVEGRLLLGVARAKEAYELLRSGALGGLSIGYKPINYEFDEINGTRRLSEVELFEISLVTFPANEAAQVTVVKGGEQPLCLGLLEELDRAIGVLGVT